MPNKKGYKYTTSHPNIARQACLMFGCNDLDIAYLFSVQVRTITRWKKIHPQFAQALETGKKEFILRTPKTIIKQVISEQKRRKRLGLRKQRD